TPASKSRRSVRLVLPASTWATIPRFKNDNARLHGRTVKGPERGSCAHGRLLWSHLPSRRSACTDAGTTIRARPPVYEVRGFRTRNVRNGFYGGAMTDNSDYWWEPPIAGTEAALIRQAVDGRVGED